MATNDGPVKVEPESFRVVHSRLGFARKDNGVGGAPYSRFVNRPAGRVLAAAAYVVGLTPNSVSIISGIFTFAGIVVLASAPANTLVGVGVMLLLLLGYALDSADGQLARLRGGGSAAGEWLDHVLDSAKLVSLHLAVLVAWFRHYSFDSDLWLLVPIVYCVAQTVAFSTMLLTELMLRVRQAREAPERKFVPPERAGSRHPVIVTLLRLPLDYGLTCAAFVLLGHQDAFVVVYSLMALAWALYVVMVLPRHFSQLQSAPEESR